MERVVAMYSAEKVEEVRRLLAEGKLSRREIAKLTGMGRMTIIRIGKGYTPGKKYVEQRKKQEKLAAAEKQLPVVINEETIPHRNRCLAVKYVRCPGCGGKVQEQVPCMLCAERKRQASIKEFEDFMAELWKIASCYPSPGLVKREGEQGIGGR